MKPTRIVGALTALAAIAILADPALLPDVHRAAYQAMLRDFITVANLL